MFATQMADRSARFTVAVGNAGGTTVSAAAILTVHAPLVTARSVTVLRPFSDRSPWNSRSTQFTLGTFVVPKSDYYPNVAEGRFSTGAFSAATTDAPMSVRGTDDSKGIYVADAAVHRIHSFYQLRNVGGVWRAQQYTWTALDGSGFGTPDEYFQGLRTAGVVTMAGLIRTSEIADGLPSDRHALAMSMTFNALAANPAYAFPATAADSNAASLNSGQIPEGALMMLPATFDLSVIKDPKLLKIARTLQTFGAYVVDANYGTPHLIYVELGSGFNLMPNTSVRRCARWSRPVNGWMRTASSSRPTASSTCCRCAVAGTCCRAPRPACSTGGSRPWCFRTTASSRSS